MYRSPHPESENVPREGKLMNTGIANRIRPVVEKHLAKDKKE
jgi:hypothetical protein